MGKVPPLVGRDDEIATIAEVLGRAEQGHGTVVIVEGEAGIGKSMLLGKADELGRARGFEVRRAACVEPERGLPFVAAVRLLAPASSRLARTFEPHLEESDLSPAMQFRLTETLGNAVESLASSQPVLLAVDDLQWADPGTLLAIRSMASRLQHLPAVLVAAVRTGHDDADLHRLVDDLVRAGAQLVLLPPLDDEAVAALVSVVTGATPATALLDRMRRAGGNPLYVTEYARWASEDDDDRLPVEFRLAVQRRLAALPSDVAEVIRVASVLGTSFLPGDLASVLDRSTIEIASSIETAITAHVIEERDESIGFRHDLVRQAVYDHIAPALRRALHREVASKLEAAGCSPLIVAHHLARAATGADPEAAAWLHRTAATVSHQAPAVAAELRERALDLLPLSSPDRIRVRADLAVDYAWSGRLTEAQTVAAEVLAGAPGPATAASMRAALVRALSWQGRPADALQLAGLRDDEPADGPGADLLAAETALARTFAADFRGAAAMAARAEEAAAASDNALALCQALSVQVWAATFAGRPHDAVELGRRAVAIADASHDGSAHLAQPRFFPAMPLVMLDRFEEAERLLRDGRRYAEERGLAWSLPLYHAFLGGKLFATGEWDAAVAECEAGLDIADELGLGVAQVLVVAAWLVAVHVHRDELEAAERTIVRARARVSGVSNIVFSWATSLVHESRRELGEALAELQSACDILLAGGALADPFSPMALVRLCVQTGDVERAAALLPAVVRQASIAGTPFMRAQALRCQGLVTDDPELLLDAVAEYRQCQRPAELAAGCEDAASGLLRQERLSDAVPLLDESHLLYERLGATRDSARVRAMLRQNGVRRSGVRRRVAAETGWESLTATELKVVELVAQRFSNPEVAERLFISRHTVESHLKRVYRKLGLSSRIELAAVAAKRS